MKPAPPVTRTGRRPTSAGRAGALVAVMPRALAARAPCGPRATRSSASCRATHSASSASPCEKSRVGAKPSSSRALRDVGDVVADVADARLAGDLGLEVGPAHGLREQRAPPRCTERSSPLPMLKTSPAAFGCSSASTKACGDVLDMDEVAALLAVLEDHRRLAVVRGARRRSRARRYRGSRAPGRARRRSTAAAPRLPCRRPARASGSGAPARTC